MPKNINSKIRSVVSSDAIQHKLKPPHNQEGNDGDIIFAVDGGVNKLYGKINNHWYSFGNGKKIGYRGTTVSREAAGNEHVQDINIDRKLIVGSAIIQSTSNLDDTGILKKNWFNINSKFFTLASTPTISDLNVGRIELQEWGTNNSSIGIPGGSNQSNIKFLIYGGDSTGGSNDGGNLYLRAGNSAGGNNGSIYIGHNGTSVIDPLTTNIYGSTITIDSAGDIELNADGGDITFKDDSASLATINGDGLTINNIGSDSAGDNYLVEVSGLVKKRTPAEVLSDLGIIAAEIIDWTVDQGGTDIHAGNYTDTNTTYTGGTNLTLDGTEFNVDDAFIKNDADDTMAGTLTIDKDSTATSTANVSGLLIERLLQ
jgi:hypothetical protein